MAQSFLPIEVVGRCKIKDDLDNVLLDETNAVHPQNMARAIARALANEHNFFVNRIAFGNGGTVVDASNHITYKTPNDGQSPDTNTWQSRLYNETYYEIIDDSNLTGISTGPGSVPANDPPSVEHVSGPGVRSTDAGLTSTVLIQCVLNASEPTGEYLSDVLGTPGFPESDFTFDEIGLFTTGAPLSATRGYQDVNVGGKNTDSDSGLVPSASYDFSIAVNGGAPSVVTVTLPGVGSGTAGSILYGDLITTLNTSLTPLGVTAAISGSGTQTYGFLRFTSNTTGVSSTVSLSDTTSSHTLLFTQLAGYIGKLTAIGGQNAGVQNAPTAPTTEAERLLTHLIFSPVLKSANRTLTVEYTLTISVSRSV